MLLKKVIHKVNEGRLKRLHTLIPTLTFWKRHNCGDIIGVCRGGRDGQVGTEGFGPVKMPCDTAVVGARHPFVQTHRRRRTKSDPVVNCGLWGMTTY